jgi:hypothetical protein
MLLRKSDDPQMTQMGADEKLILKICVICG